MDVNLSGTLVIISQYLVSNPRLTTYQRHEVLFEVHRGPCEKFYFFAFVECDLARLQRVFQSDVRAEREIQGAPAALIASGLCEVFLDHGA
jgi:hypothetical protein